MNLMPSEKVLLESDGNILVLTTHRVRYEAEAFGSGEIKSVMLEELASCVMTQTSNTIFLIIAAICFIVGAYIGRDVATGGMVLALIFLVIYFVTRKQSLLLASAGTTITFDTRGMSPEDIKKFIDRTEAAKNERYLLAKGQ
jgi:hypothetical protein